MSWNCVIFSGHCVIKQVVCNLTWLEASAFPFMMLIFLCQKMCLMFGLVFVLVYLLMMVNMLTLLNNLYCNS